MKLAATSNKILVVSAGATRVSLPLTAGKFPPKVVLQRILDQPANTP